MVQLVELNGGAPRAAGSGRILKAAEATRLLAIDAIHAAAATEAAATVRAARQEADVLVATAREEADALVAAARKEADTIRDRAQREGFAAGEAQIQDLLFDIAGRAADVVESTEARIIDLGLDVARRVIGEIDPSEVTLRTAVRGLGLAARSSFVRLRVAPAAVNAVSERVQAMLPTTAPGLQVEVIGCTRVTHPGAVLETDTGLIDATVESQLDAIRRALTRRLGRAEPAGS